MKNEEKSNNNNKYFFTFTFLCRKIYIQLKKILGKTLYYSLHCYIYITVFYVTGYWKCSNKTPTPMHGILMYILIAVDCYFVFLHQRSTFNLEKQKHLLGKMFCSPHTSNRIYLLQNCFLNYEYLKDMHITLKGIGKIVFISVFSNVSKLHTVFHVRKLISV